MAKDVIIACDFAGRKETLDFLDAFRGEAAPFVKIGMELFYAEGPEMVRELKRRGVRCVASTTERVVTEVDGKKVSEFHFVQFREY